jgi:hypothetical protein
LNKEAYEKQPEGFEVYQKETLVCRWKKILYGFKQLGTEPPMHRRSVVKTLYNRDIISNGYSEDQDDGLQIHDKLS